MGLRVSTNTQALAAQRNLHTTTERQHRSMQKLASGSRITRAADDAAGLAISEGMKASIRSMRQAARNASDGISMIQTAEGGMNEVGNILIRLRELNIQAASDTIGDTERGFVDKEVQQLIQEVDRITNATEFNSKKVLNGEGDLMEIQVGVKNVPSEDRFLYDVSKVNTSADKLGIAGMTSADKASAQENLSRLDDAIRSVTENRSELGALQNRLEVSLNNLRLYDENLSAANSRIRDVDVATETSELTKENILSTAGVAVLSQANQNNQKALQLL